MNPALAGPGGVPQLTGPNVSATGYAQISGHQGAIEGGSDPMLQLLHDKENRLDSMIDIAKIDGQVKASSVKKVGEVVKNHPDEAIAILRTWLHDKE